MGMFCLLVVVDWVNIIVLFFLCVLVSILCIVWLYRLV